MFNFQRYTSYIVLLTSYILSSCSISKQISNSAKTDVLETKALLSAHVGISIFEPATNKFWYDHQGDKYFVPASNTKLPTCYAAMKYLGDSLVGLRYRYQEYLNTFYIIPTADPTFLHPDFKSSRVLEFYRKNINKKFSYDISWIWHEFPLGSGWSWNDYEADYMAERSPFPIYGNVVRFYKSGPLTFPLTDSIGYSYTGLKSFPKYFERNLQVVSPGDSAERIKINRKLEENKFEIRFSHAKFNTNSIPFVTEGEITYLKLLKDTIRLNWDHTMRDSPESEEIVYKNGKAWIGNSWGKDLKLYQKDYTPIYSQPTDSLLKPMMHRSDNFFAEQALLMVSNERLGYMNDEKIIDTLLKTDFKDLPQKPRWADGSGLSRYNLFTPQNFVAILNKMKNEFGMDRLKVILATGGEGTISSYYKADSGYIYGKTGTLSGVVAFSGYLYTKKGKLLIFSTLVNNHNGSATEVRRAVEKFLQGIREKF